MNRQNVTTFIASTFSIQPDYPFSDDTPVFRHPDNRKWFAIIMHIRYNTLGINKNGMVDILNVKVSPMLIDTLLLKPGILPAYHMNHNHWVTLLLDGTACEQDILYLLNQSWDLTRSRKKTRLSNKQEEL